MNQRNSVKFDLRCISFQSSWEEMELNKLPLNLIPIASERVFMRQGKNYI